MRFKYEVVRKPAPVDYVTIHLLPQDVKTINSLLRNRFPELLDDESSLTYAFEKLRKEVDG